MPYNYSVKFEDSISPLAFMTSISNVPLTHRFVANYKLQIEPQDSFHFRYIEKFLSCEAARQVFEIFLRYISQKQSFLKISLINAKEAGQVEASLKTEKTDAFHAIKIIKASFEKPDYRLLASGIQKTMENMKIPEPIPARLILESCQHSWKN